MEYTRHYTGVAAAVAAGIVFTGLAMSSIPVPAAAQARPPAIELAPHRAVYTLSLGRTRQGANISGAKGVMVTEWARSCAGWTVKQRLKLDIANNDGDTVSTDSNFSSFESLDGLNYRFTNRNTRGGRVIEDVQGSARLESLGGKGTADFTQPKDLRFDLPRGTMFPMIHMKALLDAARGSQRVLYKVMFDGATLDGPIAVNAIIGAARDNPPPEVAKEPLTNRRSWQMRLAFFPLNNAKSEPDYELGLRAYDNGVSDEYVIDYGSFAVDARLERIEALEKPKC